MNFDISSDFLKEEIRFDYTITSEMKSVWAIELELLYELDEACEKLGISYFLDCGTLLGAVRDHRFIPWDDDIDVIMTREDYEILKINNKTVFKEPTFFQCAYTDINYPRGHAQLRKKGTCGMIPYESRYVKFDQSIFIDIFVLDGIATDRKLLEKQFAEKSRIYNVMEIIGIPSSTIPINIIAKNILRPFLMLKYPSIPELFEKYERVCRRFNDSEYVDKIMFRETTDKLYYLKRDWFSDKLQMEFEGGMFPVPIGYHDVLRTYYGDDYMKPTKAPTAHGRMIFDSKRSFQEVLSEMKKE